MIQKKDYEVLYYKTPRKYRAVLDGKSDPNTYVNYDLQKALGEKLLECPKIEFLETIINIFKNKYADARKINIHITEYDIKTKISTSLRKDFKQLIFDFRQGVINDLRLPDEYLDNLFIEFDTEVTDINNCIKNALQEKNYTETISEAKTIFTIKSSPILKIIASRNTFQLFLDKKSFVDYGTW